MIDTATNTVLTTIALPVGASPQGVAINPAGTRVYITDTNNANVLVIDTATNTIIATVPVGATPEGVDVTPDGSNVYVANSFSSSVSVISAATNTVTTTILFGPSNAPFAFGKFIGGTAAPPPPPPAAATQPVPTLGEWALMAMITSLLACGIWSLRGKRRS